MALSQVFFATSLLLFSLLILASASDYGYGSKPEGNDYGFKPYVQNSKPENKGYTSKPESYGYDSKPYLPKANPEGKPYADKLKPEEKSSGVKSYVEKSKQEDESKPYVEESTPTGFQLEGYTYGRKLNFYKSKSVEYHKDDSYYKPSSANSGRKSTPTGY